MTTQKPGFWKFSFFLGCLLALLATLPVAAQDTPPLTYSVQPGDALPALAEHFGTDVATVMRLNGLQDPRRIYPGQPLVFPGDAFTAYEWRPLASGETLRTLARRANIHWETLARANILLKPATPLIGQSLYLPPLAQAQTVMDTPPEPRLVTALRRNLPYWRVVELNPRPAYSGDVLLVPSDASPAPPLPYPVTALSVTPQPVARGHTVALALTTEITTTCEVIYRDEAAPCYARDADAWIALVAIPPLATPGLHTITVQLQTDVGSVALPIPLHVTRGRYDYERIDLPTSRQALLDPQLSQNERVKVAQLRTLRTPERLWEYPFRWPIEASVTSYFGSRRSYGAGFTSYHDGTDFQGETGAPVLAPASGVVILAEPLVVRGNAILIDHGWGVVSGYWHLSRIDVTVGQRVTPGEQIAAMGNTGLSTGPHLHWELWVNGKAVSALQWVTDFAPELRAMTELAAYRRAGWTVQYWPQTGSTNDVALDAGRQGAAEKLLVLADEQTAGRGRLARRWESPPGTCLLMSLLFRPPEPFAHSAARITMLCGLALAEAVEMVGGLAAPLKWPNDLIVTEPGTWRKLAGMLSEIGLERDAPAFLVVGIGLNVAVPPGDLPKLAPNATSLLAETGRTVSRAALLDAFLAQVETRYAQLLQGDDPQPAWRACLAWLGQPVTVHTPTQTMAGVAEDVDATGALRVRAPDGSAHSFAVGDVSLRV